MKRCILITLPILLLMSCTNQTSTNAEPTDKALLATDVGKSIIAVTDTTYIDTKGYAHKYLGIIPDSLRTEEQSRLIKLINENTYKYMSVKDNHMVYELTREQFIAKGIPGRYFDLLQKSINEINHFFDANGIKNVDKMVRETKEELGLSR
ncbi:MAG: hypothetical protein V4687_02200 [Bacteroidota bacterium]